MPSKGIQVYSYIAVPGCAVEFSVPKQTLRRDQQNAFSNDGLEVEARNIDNFFNKNGKFSFKVLRDGNVVTEQWIMVNAITGGLGNGTMNTIANTPTIVQGDLMVSYGFYDAGAGRAGLPNRHQCYVTVTPNHSDWIGRVAPPGSPQENRPFHSLALPAPHDVGMNSMQNCEALLSRAGSAVLRLIGEQKVLEQFANTMSAPAIAAIAPNIIYSLAITQKDSLATMLQLGARYFEFRPAHCHNAVLPVMPIPDTLYFQHSAIPGMAYDQFLRDLISFLQAHPSELAVVHLRWDGVPPECRHPDDEELNRYLSDAIGQSNGAVVAGNLEDMTRASIADLRRQNKRLIVIKSVDSLSTYTDEGNATTTGDSIITAFNNILLGLQATVDRPFINIQCQATATNVPDAVVYSVLSASASTSCLLATKALCDYKTLRWVREHGFQACRDAPLLVVMNDFFDGATADVAVQLSRQRLG